ncbi:MAG: hypothetical protein HDKAJFGB_03897 [Anaerolineae bacterium]|nr:hypothetical protein [Anaerolineae bacterium]
MQNAFRADFSLNEMRHRPRAHSHLRARRIGDVDHIRARLFQNHCARENFVGIETARRRHFDADDKMARVEFLL